MTWPVARRWLFNTAPEKETGTGVLTGTNYYALPADPVPCSQFQYEIPWTLSPRRK